MDEKEQKQNEKPRCRMSECGQMLIFLPSEEDLAICELISNEELIIN